MLNVVFTGEFTYPDGMAGTKRIQHFIDYLSSKSRVRVFLFNKDTNANTNLKIEGLKNNIKYQIIGSGIHLSFALIYELPLVIFYSFSVLLRWKNRQMKNILYVYNGINLENIFYVLFARLIGYFIVVEYVEDFALYAGKLPEHVKFKNRTNVFFERFLPFLSDGIVVISTYLLNKFNKYSNKIPIIHIPVSALTKTSDQNRSSFGSPIRIVYSGTFGEKDGLQTLITAFVKFSEQYANCRLLLTGKTKNSQLIDSFIMRSHRIDYLGFIPESDFYSFLAGADILCITRSKMKFADAGFPFKLGEYLSTGKPVITSNVSDINLYLKNYHDALIVDPDNPDQIIEAFRYLIDHQDKAFEIGRNGQKKCMKYFNPATNGKLLLDFLISLS